MGRHPLHRLTSHYRSLLAPTFQQLSNNRVVERLWAKDHRLWKPEPAEITNRLGWLMLHRDMQGEVDRLRRLAGTAQAAGVKDVVLLGMGGSSLGPEVLRSSFGSQKGYPRLWVLDSTVPGWVRHVTASIHPARTIFLVASKSGGTIEVLSLFAHFWTLVGRMRGNRVGEQFVAITDPGTGLEKMAQNYGFGNTFTNPPDIGGRYSVLSLFGLVPAALLGLDIGRLLSRARGMADQCRQQDPSDANPGAALGATMGALAKTGRDKVTVIASSPLLTFGLWVEQLLAESTGKEGTGLIPVAQEPVRTPGAYGQDRLFVYLRLKGAKNALLDARVESLVRAGHPVLQCDLRDTYDLGAEFFRWEYATAVAGHLLSIHPFDQPNVQESKDNTNRVLQGFKANGRLPEQASSNSKQAAKELTDRVRPGAYIAVLAYTRPSGQLETAIRRFRALLVDRYHVTTTFGYGPRYLHSTGQLHKGGPNCGIFLELIDGMTPDVVIPGQPYSFGTLAQAQAAGDLESLRAHDRYVIQVRLGADPAATVRAITHTLARSVVRPRRTTSPKRRRPVRHR
jgi:glucose-6-phosphate isomerase/transaldolase/glucose-6-phosphate isomerase